MRKLSTLLILVFICLISKAQQEYSAFIDFEHDNSMIEIDNNQPNNIWQIGTPSKIIFDSAYSLPLAIVTDTLSYYPPNNLSSFQIKVIPPFGCWGIGYMYFSHKYDTRPGKDGGYLEIKYEGDTNWTNIIFDTEPLMGINTNDFYSSTDTISGGEPAFNGSSNGWKFSSFNWNWFIGVKSEIHDTLFIRFTFKSDSLQSNKEGWLIDNISIWLHLCMGSVEELQNSDHMITLFPNPAPDAVNIECPLEQDLKISLFNIIGEQVMQKDCKGSKEVIDINALPAGMYIVKVSGENWTAQKKLIKE